MNSLSPPKTVLAKNQRATTRRVLGMRNEAQLMPPVIPNLFFYAFLFFICSQYLFAKEIFANIFFYGMLFPAFIWHYRGRLVEVVFKPRDSASWLVLVLFFYVVLHTIFIRQWDWRTLGVIGSSLSNYIFFIAAREYFANTTMVDKRVFFKSVVFVASIGAVISFVDYGLNYDFPRRLRPWNSTNHEIAGSSVYAICCLISGFIFFENKVWKARVLMVIACLLFFGVMLLAQSRGPIVALVVSGLFLGFAYYRLRFLLVLSVGLLKSIIVLYIGYGLVPEKIEYLVSSIFRADSYRMAIFEFTTKAIMKHPWLGYGMRAGFDSDIAANPHNIFLGTAFYLGVTGLVLLILMLSMAFYRAYKAVVPYGLKMLAIALLIYGCMASISDNARIVRSPTGAWFFFWMPVALCLSMPRRCLYTSDQYE